MKDGNDNAPNQEVLVPLPVPPNYQTFAQGILDQPEVLEVWAMVSPLPEIRTVKAAFTLDSGVWFLCRVNYPLPANGADGIIAFIPEG